MFADPKVVLAVKDALGITDNGANPPPPPGHSSLAAVQINEPATVEPTLRLAAPGLAALCPAMEK